MRKAMLSNRWVAAKEGMCVIGDAGRREREELV
jgi:hypothetical protein